MTDPRESDDRLVSEIVRTADELMRVVEGIAYASMTAGTLDCARALVELERIRKLLTNNKAIKRRALIEATNKVGAVGRRKPAPREKSQ